MSPDDRIKELERENAELVGILRMFLWIDREARLDDKAIHPEDAYEGTLRREYKRAITLAGRWARTSATP